MSLGEHFWLDVAALAVALILDVALGEPPARVHPVVFMGKAVGWLTGLAPRASPIAQFGYGLGMAVAVPAAAASAGYFLVVAMRDLDPVVYVLVTGFLLKACFAVGGLERAARAVRERLEAGELGQAREDLTALVSRDTSSLTLALAASAAVESVAENTTDSFVAPWLAFALLGLPGALAYRAVNTLDAMIGYHGKYEYLGKVAARLDDALNFIPARLSAIIIAAAGPLRGHSARRALRVMRKEGNTVASPNAGLPMAAMAGALGVALEKVGHYRLGAGLRQPVAADITESVRVMQWAAFVACSLAAAVLMVRHALL